MKVTANARRQGVALFTTVLVMIGVLVILQLWLLSAALESMLAGGSRTAVPATIASLVLFAINVGLSLYVRGFDRRMRQSEGEKA